MGCAITFVTGLLTLAVTVAKWSAIPPTKMIAGFARNPAIQSVLIRAVPKNASNLAFRAQNIAPRAASMSRGATCHADQYAISFHVRKDAGMAWTAVSNVL